MLNLTKVVVWFWLRKPEPYHNFGQIDLIKLHQIIFRPYKYLLYEGIGHATACILKKQVHHKFLEKWIIHKLHKYLSIVIVDYFHFQYHKASFKLINKYIYPHNKLQIRLWCKHSAAKLRSTLCLPVFPRYCELPCWNTSIHLENTKIIQSGF